MTSEGEVLRPKLEEALAKPVYCHDSYVQFGELNAEQARGLAAELGSAGTWGPMAKVGSVARSWEELAEAIESSEAGKVSELTDAQILEFAARLWILPSGGGLL